MSINSYVLSAPYVCAFAVDTAENKLGACFTVPDVVNYYGDQFDELRQFETLEEALTSARLVDPACPKNYVYGPLPLTTSTSPSGLVEVDPGETVIIDATADSTEATATFSYTWFKNGVKITDATSNTFEITFTEADLSKQVQIQCTIDAEALDDWTNSHTRVVTFYNEPLLIAAN